MAVKYIRAEKPPSVCDSTEIVTISIAKSKGENFCVHAHLLAHHSDYFLVALNSQTGEPNTLHFDLGEHDKEAVKLFIAWVYAKSSVLESGTEVGDSESIIMHLKHPEYPSDTVEYEEALAQAWKFGEYLQAWTFKHEVLRTLHKIVVKLQIDSHPFTCWSDEDLEALDTTGPVFRLFAATMGHALYATHNPREANAALQKLGPEAHAAVTKYIITRSFKMAEEVANQNNNGHIAKRDSNGKLTLEELLEVFDDDEDWV